MKIYKFYWLGTKSNHTISKGNTPEEAFTNAGYGAGAVRALDYYEEISDPDEL